MSENQQTLKAKSNDLVITRLFDAPLARVWHAWTDPELMTHWWGPKTFTAPVCQIDLRVGGRILCCMRSPEGQDFWSTGVYREVTPMQRLVCTDSFADAEGNVVPATYYGMEEMPLELLITVTFEEQAGQVRMTLRHAGFPPGEMAGQARQGWDESFDKLASIL